ncbi:MAG: hypothetical protein ACJAT5_000538 [Lentimonas sp.]|jgi:hypothetical protein
MFKINYPMQNTFYPAMMFMIAFLAITANSTDGAQKTTVVTLSNYPVKVKEGENSYFLEPDKTGSNSYTILKGTTLIFEATARILTDEDVGVLSSEWYNSSTPNNNGSANLLLGWWWWTGDGKNPEAPKETPDQPNTPNALPNTGKEGLFVFEQSFNETTPVDSPLKITAVLYPVKPGKISPPAIVDFFVHVVDVANAP